MNNKENVYKKSEIQILINEVYIEYTTIFKKYRKETTHFSKCGKYVERIKNDYERWGNLIWVIKIILLESYLKSLDLIAIVMKTSLMMLILIIRGFIDNIKKLLIKTEFKKSVQEKLFTDKKLTFEEYTTLLEIVTEKFRDSFNCNNGKFDIIFWERTLEEKLNKNLEKECEEIENEK